MASKAGTAAVKPGNKRVAGKDAPSKGSSKGSSLGAGAVRTEKDTMGEMQVPADVLYGASTQRAVLNFPVSGRPVPFPIVEAYAAIKSACATVNLDLGRIDRKRATAIVAACKEIAGGLREHGGWERHFPIDIFQTGSGTSTNMNANEVIANLVCIARGAPIGSSKDQDYLRGGGVHPNDHVNMGQSSNDTFPTAMHVAAYLQVQRDLMPALAQMREQLEKQAKSWDKVVKIGRTHLQDATPIRLGQEFSGFAAQLKNGEERLRRALETLSELALGGTAVGTGINTHEKFGALVADELNKSLLSGAKGTGAGDKGAKPRGASGPAFREARNHFEAQHAKDAFVEASGHLRTIAVSLSKIAGDIRLMGMGPRCGLGELVIPAVQPGSSIMPGKVNPVICESLVMVCCQVIGNDAAVATGALGGVGSLLDLNVTMPMMAANVLDSTRLLAAGCRMFTGNCLRDLRPDLERCKGLIEGSLAMCTSLVPVIGYDRSAALAKDAFKAGKTVRELAYETVVGQRSLRGDTITRADIDAALDPWSMTLPGGEGSAGG